MAERVVGVYGTKDIASNATTVAKTGAGVLHAITVTKAGTAWQAKVYNNTAASGTVLINEVDLNAEVTLVFDATFSTGLTVVTSGTTPGEAVVSYA